MIGYVNSVVYLFSFVCAHFYVVVCVLLLFVTRV